MSKLEKLIRQKGGVLVSTGKHKRFRIGDQDFWLSHSDRCNDDKPVYRKYWNQLRRM